MIEMKIIIQFNGLPSVSNSEQNSDDNLADLISKYFYAQQRYDEAIEREKEFYAPTFIE